MALNKIFSKIFVINLKRRIDRRIICTKKMEKYNINYDFFDAIDGNDAKYNNICASTKLSRGAVGLILTYVKLLESAMCNMQNKDDMVLIMEDDVNFHKDFMQKINGKIINNIDCLWLGANQSSYSDIQKKQIDEQKNYYDVSNHSLCFTYGTFAIAMNKRMMIELRKSINISQLIYPIDVQINKVISMNKLSGKIIYPFLIMPDVTDSDNNGKRKQEEFVIERNYQISDYDFVSLVSVSNMKNILNEKKISLRQLFKKKNAKLLTFEEFDNAFSFLNDNVDVKKFVTEYFDCFRIDNVINLNNFFYCMEEKKSFVFIIRSFNLTNYRIIIESMMRQIYPNYQFRIIFCNGNNNSNSELNLRNYIEKHGFCNCISFDEVDCFDDEIVIDMNGNDWLFDEFVLDFLNDKYTENNINCLHGCGYFYNMCDMKSGQSMGIPYGPHNVDNRLNKNCFKSRYAKNHHLIDKNECFHVNKPLIICDKTIIK